MAGTIDVVPKKGFRTPVPVDPKTGSPLWYSDAKSVDVSPIKDVKTASEVQSMQEKFQKDIAQASRGKGRRKTRKIRKTRKSRKSRR
jgi:hypothetical protein